MNRLILKKINSRSHKVQQSQYENPLANKWVPLKLIIAVLAILSISAVTGFKLDNMAIQDQERLFNQQQALQAKLAATALGDRLQNIVSTAQTLSLYSLKDFLEGQRSNTSIQKLFKIKQNETNSMLLFTFHKSPSEEILTSEITTPRLVISHDLAAGWVSKYFSILSSMRSGFITPRPLINKKERLAGILFPVWVNHKFSGVLTLIIDLDQLTNRYITPLQIGKFGSGYIVDGSGTVVFDQEKEIIGKNIFELHKDFPSLIKIDSRMLHERSGKGEYSFYVKRGAYESRKLIAWDTAYFGEMKLVIAISAPEKDVTKSMSSIRVARIAMIGLMGFTIFASIFFFYHYRSKQILLGQNNELKRKDQLFEAIADNVPGVIYKCDMHPPYELHYISPKINRLTGHDQFEFLNDGLSHYIDLVHPDDRNNLKKSINDAINDNDSFNVEYRLINNDGATRWVFERGTKLPDQDSIVGFILDITDRQKEEKALQEAEEKYRTIVDNAPLGIFQATQDGKFISANPQMAKLYGYESPNSLIKEISDISTQCYVSSESRRRLLTILNEFGRTSNFEAEHSCRDGSSFWAAETVTAVNDENGNLTHYDGFMVDISERKEHEETMRRLAMYDSLTGLPNRVLFDDRVKQALSRAKRSRMKVAILYADLDNFKPVNDELGHIAGDSVLKEVAGRFSDCLRTSDTVSRIGGDEFIFILQDIGANTEIEVVAQRIIETMRTPFYLAEKVYRLGVSIGISIYPESGTEKEELVRLADEAMYKAKTGGKNSFSY